ncbi:hypothetical protein G9C85_09905 [Halorubellus sp. JP-L1]|uniref:hypothetical protein n=1 Tax=Halorubellus sp. JP-L1 TaxID=2715753 RepID=UPI00140AF842|nr:hypothetical protein [Halorubellus sp. JP-L1]NHN41940.1 hypothetical protein [Halorubellus sp. JP-L1]
MQSASSVAPVSAVDRALGALVTFAGGAVVGFVLALLLAPNPTESALVVPLATAVLAGTAAAGALVYAGGYDRILIPVEGRRWTVELAFALAVVAGAFALADVADVVSDVLVVGIVALSLLGTRRIGDAVADARGWYDRDDYYRENER